MPGRNDSAASFDDRARFRIEHSLFALSGVPRRRDEREVLRRGIFLFASGRARARAGAKARKLGCRGVRLGRLAHSLAREAFRSLVEAAQKPEKPVEDGQGVGRAARNVEIDRNVLRHAAL